MGIDVPKDLKFIKGGRLNMVCIRNGKEVDKVMTDTPAFLANTNVVGSTSMDVIKFQSKVVFKVTLDFKQPLPCMEGTAVRETTDWVLLSCMGEMAFFNRVEERLVLQQCVVSVQSNVSALATPVAISLYFDEDEWLVDRVSR